MEPTETGAGGAGEMPQAEAPARVAEPAITQRKSRDGMLIALIAVSCMALVLLGSTITLALVGDFGGGGGFRIERPGLQDTGQMQRQGVEQFRELRKDRLENLKERGQERRQENSSEEEPAEVPSEGTAPETRVVPGNLQIS